MATFLAVVPGEDGPRLADALQFTGLRLTTYRGTAVAPRGELVTDFVNG